eukprot:SAG25_NODE_1184_length_3667_cov_11.095852_1_plen_52_part_00
MVEWGVADITLLVSWLQWMARGHAIAAAPPVTRQSLHRDTALIVPAMQRQV